MKKFVKVLLAVMLTLVMVCSFAACKKDKTVDVTIELQDGRKIELVLYPKYAPVTVENFVSLAKEGYYDGLCISNVSSSYFVAGDYAIDAQSGDSYTVKKTETRPSIKGEFYNNGHIVQNEPMKHIAGAISMMRDADSFDSASTAFFLCGSSMTGFDRSYAVFGYTKDDASLEVIQDVLKVETTTYEVNDEKTLTLPSEAVIIKTIVVHD